MYFTPGYIYHIYNKGNNNQKLFFIEDNYHFFLAKARKELLPYFNFLAYCLMPNHFHFLVQVKEKPTNSSDDFKSSDESFLTSDEFSKLISKHIAILLRSYTRAINKQEIRTGSLFQQKTKAKCLNETSNSRNNYVSACFHYIHQNPLNASIVRKLEVWKFSSFQDYAGLRNGTLCNQELAYEIINFNMINFREQSYAIIEEKNLKGIWV